MWSSTTEKSLSKFISVGLLSVTLVVWTSTGTDPVNVPKLWICGGLAGSSFAIAVGLGFHLLAQKFRLLLCAAIIFVISMINSVVNSHAPWSQTIFGVYGRNTGLLTYLLLVLFMISVALLHEKSSFKTILNALLFAGTVNVMYCGWVLVFGDFIPWNNQYKSILGTLGNPDFISAFLGFYIVVIFSQLLDQSQKTFVKLVGLILALLALGEIVKSHAIQGLVVVAGGTVVIGFFYLRSKFESLLLQLFYLGVSAALGILAVLGTLQKGPLSFVYKKSVSLRGSYWHAGIEMGKSHPFTGIGMDTYGDWYRATRPAVAFVDTPPPSVVSNVAHNVVIDLFAFGGWPLVLSYLGITLLGAISIFRVLLRSNVYDPIFVGIAVLWICYEVQSIISINQIGLAVWGWMATGALLAFEKGVINPSYQSGQRSKRKSIKDSNQAISANLIGGVGLVIGLIVAFPPMNADTKWRSALDSRNLQNLESALTPSLMNPPDSTKYAQAIVTLRNSNLNDLAMKYAKKAVEFNPDSTDAWAQMYLISTATSEERKLALKNLKRLDPNNPDLLGNLK